MNQDEIYDAWSNDRANSIVDELVRGGVLKQSDYDRAAAIAAQDLFIALVSGLRPDANYKPMPGPPKWKQP